MLNVINGLLLALRQLPEREMRGPLILSLLWTVLAFAVLWFAAGVALRFILAGRFWAEWAAGLTGAVAAPLLTILLFPMISTAILGLYSEAIVVAVERRFYPFLLPPPPTRWGDQIRSLLWLTAIGVTLNVLALPLYLLLPGANLVLFFLLNGYLLGRGYYELVALRRLDWRSARQLWHRYRFSFILVGATLAGLFSVPLVNLLAPIIGTAAAVHLFERISGHGALRTGE